MDIRQATTDDLEALAPLFDGYRQFYGFAPDMDGARRFLADRIDKDESTVFMAWRDGQAIGFTQLYPSFSSGRMQRIYILNDLFVSPSARGTGAGRALLDTARTYGEAQGAAGLTLSTAVDNTIAQTLYQANGWERESDYWTYNLPLLQA